LILVCVYSMDKAFLSKVLKLINSGLTTLEKKKITESDVLQLNIHIYNTLKENPEALEMFADYMQKLQKSKGDIHSIIGKKGSSRRSSRRSSSRSKSLGLSSRRSSRRSSRSKSLGKSSRRSSLGRGRRTRKSGRSGRARGNSDENRRISNICGVCLGELDDGQPITSHDAGEGRHTYHVECISNWWRARPNDNNKCAECKQRIPANRWMTDGQPTVFPQPAQAVHAPPRLARIQPLLNHGPRNTDVYELSDDEFRALAEYVVDNQNNWFTRMDPENTRLYQLLINEYRGTLIGERFVRAMNYHITTRNIESTARLTYIAFAVIVLVIIFLRSVSNVEQHHNQSRR
jgi:hypothetical protein